MRTSTEYFNLAGAVERDGLLLGRRGIASDIVV